MPVRYHHEALPYAGRREFVPACVSVVREGFEHDERLIVLASRTKLAEVRDALGSDGEDVAFVPTDEHGRNPSRITTLMHSFQASGGGRHSLGVNEPVVFGRSPAAQLEAQLAESVLNDPVLRALPLSVVCLYDTSQLDPAALEAMRQSHAVIRGESRNPQFRPHLAKVMRASEPDPPPEDALFIDVHGPDLPQLRSAVRTCATGFGIAPDRADDLVLAANEIVSNSLRHGGGAATVALWTDGKSVVCEVRDRGVIRDPLAGQLAPAPDATSGRGLWLANHLCDLVAVRSSRAAGTIVRLYVDV